MSVIKSRPARIVVESGYRPRIEGHRIRVQDIVNYHVHGGMPVHEVADGLELTLAEVHAALAYYYDHQEEIDADIKKDQGGLVDYPSLYDVAEGRLKLIMTPQEIAEEFPITIDAVYQAVRNERIRHRRSGKTILILRADAAERWGK